MTLPIEVSSVGKYKVCRVLQKDCFFWENAGPLLVNKSVVKELDGPLFDSVDHHWLLAIAGSKVVGFTSLTTERMDKKIIECTAAYVIPEHRRKGLYTELFKQREKLGFALGATELRGVANPISKHVFDNARWEVTRTAGKWTHFRKVASDGQE